MEINLRAILSLGCIALSLSQSSISCAETVYVNPGVSQSSSQNGLSWDQAFSSLDRAFQNAKSGSEFWIASGTVEFTGGDLPGDSKIIGGFSGNESTIAERNPQSGRTIFVYSESAGPLVVSAPKCAIDGIDFIQAKNTALVIQNASPEISNCGFDRNTGEKSGAVVCADHSSPLFSFCRFSQNQSNVAGAVLAIEQSQPRFSGCDFSWNQSSSSGAGLFGFECVITLVDCELSFNFSPVRGAAIALSKSSATIRSCTLIQNRVTEENSHGGAVYADQGSVIFHDVLIKRNSADNGGGMFASDMENVEIHNSHFVKNCAAYEGGGLALINAKNALLSGSAFKGNYSTNIASGLYMASNGNARILGCEFSGNVVLNSNGHGAGLYLKDQANTKIVDSAFIRNLTHSWFTKGGGIFLKTGKVECYFTLFWENQAMLGAELGGRYHPEAYLRNCALIGDGVGFSTGVDCLDIADHEYYYDDFVSTASIQNCVLWGYGLESFHPLRGFGANIVGRQSTGGLVSFAAISDLGFENAGAGDFRLRSDSPLIDAGDSAMIEGRSPNDGDHDGIARWDIGAFER